MRRDAYRTSNKIIKRCPYCGRRKPKELVEGPKRLNVVALVFVLVAAPFLCLVPLIFLPFCWRSRLEAYCGGCGESFAV